MDAQFKCEWGIGIFVETGGNFCEPDKKRMEKNFGNR